MTKTFRLSNLFPMPMKNAALRKQAAEWVPTFFDVATIGGGVELRFARSLNSHLGLRMRSGEASHQINKRLNRIGTELPRDGSGISLPDVTVEVWRLLQELDLALGALAQRPLTARQTQEALGISTRERSRWTKDGRLPAQGTALIRRGQLISLKTYVPSVIQRLIDRREIVKQWREQDAVLGRS